MFSFSMFYSLFIYMGRKSLNKTYEQILAENRVRSRAYYKLHRDDVNKKSMERYNNLKQKSKDEIRNIQDNQ
jgi:hypothetical protein